MSIVWTLIATFLYSEIVLVLLFVLPIASPARWQRFFRSRFLAMLSRQAQTYFYLLVGVLILFLLEAIREMRKYSQIGKFYGIVLRRFLKVILLFLQIPITSVLKSLCNIACGCFGLSVIFTYPAFRFSSH